MNKQKIIFFYFIFAAALLFSGCGGPQNRTSLPINPVHEDLSPANQTEINQTSLPAVGLKTNEIDKEVESIDAEIDSIQGDDLGEESLSDAEMGL